MHLKNKVAIITGAASGIGKGIAETFAKAGAKVVITDLDYEKANTVADEISVLGGDAIALAMNVTDEQQVDNAILEVIKAYDGIDILISNAGIQHIDSIENLSYLDWKQILDVHLNGAFLTTKACLKQMYQQNRGGSIIYIGSVHSKEASMLKAPYVTAKHGLIGLCKTVAKEGAKYQVRANIICPGYVKTPLVEKQIPEQAKLLGITEEDVIKKIMLKDTVDGEFTTIEDIAQIALLFAAFESNALTGQSIIASHGWFMQ